MTHAVLQAQRFKVHSCPIMCMKVGRRGCKRPERIRPYPAIRTHNKYPSYVYVLLPVCQVHFSSAAGRNQATVPPTFLWHLTAPPHDR